MSTCRDQQAVIGYVALLVDAVVVLAVTAFKVAKPIMSTVQSELKWLIFP